MFFISIRLALILSVKGFDLESEMLARFSLEFLSVFILVEIESQVIFIVLFKITGQKYLLLPCISTERLKQYLFTVNISKYKVCIRSINDDSETILIRFRGVFHNMLVFLQHGYHDFIIDINFTIDYGRSYFRFKQNVILKAFKLSLIECVNLCLYCFICNLNKYLMRYEIIFNGPLDEIEVNLEAHI